MFDIETLPQDVLNEVFSLLSETEQDNVKFINKAFYKSFLFLRNQKCFAACKQFFGFEPPSENAFIIFQICAFIESKGASHKSKDKNILIKSANDLLKNYRYLKETRDWAYYYSSLLCLNFGAPAMLELAAQYCVTAVGFEFTPALCLLAEFYYKGEAGFPKDKKLMFKYFMLASDKGNVVAKRKIGISYLKIKDNRGLTFIKDAANANDIESLIILGNLHKDNKLIDASANIAIGYFNKAIELGSSKAADILAKAFSSYESGIIQRDDAKAKTYRMKYYEIEAKAKNGVAARMLALLYIKDNQDDKGLQFLKLAMEFKDGIGTLELARLYRKRGEDKTKIITCYASAYTFLSTAKRTVEIDDILSNSGLDGLWLISQGELKLGAQFLTETNAYSRNNNSDSEILYFN